MKQRGQGEIVSGTDRYIAERVDRKIKDILERITQEINHPTIEGETAFRCFMNRVEDTLREIFDEEENLMIAMLYPDYSMQRDSHRYFLEELRSCRQ